MKAKNMLEAHARNTNEKRRDPENETAPLIVSGETKNEAGLEIEKAVLTTPPVSMGTSRKGKPKVRKVLLLPSWYAAEDLDQHHLSALIDTCQVEEFIDHAKNESVRATSANRANPSNLPIDLLRKLTRDSTKVIKDQPPGKMMTLESSEIKRTPASRRAEIVTEITIGTKAVIESPTVTENEIETASGIPEDAPVVRRGEMIETTTDVTTEETKGETIEGMRDETTEEMIAEMVVEATTVTSVGIETVIQTGTKTEKRNMIEIGTTENMMTETGTTSLALTVIENESAIVTGTGTGTEMIEADTGRLIEETEMERSETVMMIDTDQSVRHAARSALPHLFKSGLRSLNKS